MKHLINSLNKPQEIPGVFLHGIDLKNWYPCWNIPISGELWSPDLYTSGDPAICAVHKSIRDLEISQLEMKPSSIIGFLSPRVMKYIWPAAVIREGGRVGYGLHNTDWLPDAEMDFIEESDIELKFEEVRRKILPNAASRLCCLFVAENTQYGIELIKKIFPNNDLRIVKVTIPMALRFNKVDSKWFDEYHENPKDEYIKNYWMSVPYDESVPTWEYLLEGLIKIKYPEDLEFIRKYGAKP